MAKATFKENTSEIELTLSRDEASALVEVLDFADTLEDLNLSEASVFRALKGVVG